MGKAEELKEKLFSNVLLPNIGILLLAAGGEMRNHVPHVALLLTCPVFWMLFGWRRGGIASMGR